MRDINLTIPAGDGIPSNLLGNYINLRTSNVPLRIFGRSKGVDIDFILRQGESYKSADDFYIIKISHDSPLPVQIVATIGKNGSISGVTEVVSAVRSGNVYTKVVTGTMSGTQELLVQENPNRKYLRIELLVDPSKAYGDDVGQIVFSGIHGNVNNPNYHIKLTAKRPLNSEFIVGSNSIEFVGFVPTSQITANIGANNTIAPQRYSVIEA